MQNICKLTSSKTFFQNLGLGSRGAFVAHDAYVDMVIVH